MKALLKFMIFMLVCIPFLVFAQDSSTTSALAEAAEALPGAPDILKAAQAWVEANLAKFGIGLAILIDLVLRLVPTPKAVGVLHMIVASLKVICAILEAVVKFLDGVLQKRK